MGKLNVFDISFSNPYGIYYPGAKVQGQLTIETDEPLKMRGLRVRIQGKAKNHWIESRRIGNQTQIIHYRASEVYVDDEILLYGQLPNQGSEQVELPQGQYSYSFQFQLPAKLPGSFEEKVGRVRYCIKGIVDRPWKFDHKCKRAFTVLHKLDLNREPSATTPAEASDEKTLCCCCCKTGPITGTVRVDRRGYVPGEAVTFRAEVNNNSSRKMKNSKVYLNMVASFQGHAYGGFPAHKQKLVSKKVARVSRVEIAEGGNDVYSGQQLVIPPLPPSHLVGCSIIDIKYTLELQVKPKGPSFSLVVPVEILIGTIPLESIIQQYPPLPMQPPPIGDTRPLTSALPEIPPTALPPNIPPPSYRKCVLGKTQKADENDGKYTRGSLEFAPYCIWYNWGHEPS